MREWSSGFSGCSCENQSAHTSLQVVRRLCLLIFVVNEVCQGDLLVGQDDFLAIDGLRQTSTFSSLQTFQAPVHYSYLS